MCVRIYAFLAKKCGSVRTYGRDIFAFDAATVIAGACDFFGIRGTMRGTHKKAPWVPVVPRGP